MSAHFQIFGAMKSNKWIEVVPPYENTGARLYEIVINPAPKLGETPEPILCSLRVAPDRQTGQFHLPAEGSQVVGLGSIYGRQGTKQLFVHLQLRSLQAVNGESTVAPATGDDDIPL